jgi:hypothetical protein
VDQGLCPGWMIQIELSQRNKFFKQAIKKGGVLCEYFSLLLVIAPLISKFAAVL